MEEICQRVVEDGDGFCRGVKGSWRGGELNGGGLEGRGAVGKCRRGSLTVGGRKLELRIGKM